MSEFTDYLETEVLDHILGKQASNWTPTTNLYVDLLTASGTDSDDLRGQLTIPTSGSYAPLAVTFAAASAGSKKNTTALTWTNTATGPDWSVVGIAISDGSATGSNVYMFDNDMTDATIGQNEKLQITSSGITVTLA